MFLLIHTLYISVEAIFQWHKAKTKTIIYTVSKDIMSNFSRLDSRFNAPIDTVIVKSYFLFN